MWVIIESNTENYLAKALVQSVLEEKSVIKWQATLNLKTLCTAKVHKIKES